MNWPEMKLQIPAINIKPIIMSLLKLFISYDPVINCRDLYAALLLFCKFCCVNYMVATIQGYFLDTIC